MATKQTLFYTGNARPVFGNNFRSGSPIAFRHTHTFLAAVLSTDVLELFTLPAYAQINRFEMISANVGLINVNVGLMTGTPGDAVTARTAGSELISAAAANTTLLSTLLQRTTFGKVGDSPVSVGLTPAADITAAANKTITFEVEIF